jgi:hypothetical protein
MGHYNGDDDNQSVRFMIAATPSTVSVGNMPAAWTAANGQRRVPAGNLDGVGLGSEPAFGGPYVCYRQERTWSTKSAAEVWHPASIIIGTQTSSRGLRYHGETPRR